MHAFCFQVSKPPADASKPIDKQYCDTVVNFLLRIACQVVTGRHFFSVYRRMIDTVNYVKLGHDKNCETTY